MRMRFGGQHILKRAGSERNLYSQSFVLVLRSKGPQCVIPEMAFQPSSSSLTGFLSLPSPGYPNYPSPPPFPPYLYLEDQPYLM